MADIGSVIDGKYKIVKQIGEGGMSAVYLAVDLRLNKKWAVKEIQKRGSGPRDEVVVNSLLTETEIMKRLDHPALPRIVDIIEEQEDLMVVMDYIEGESLDRILENSGPLPEKLVLNWAKQICDAFIYLHSRKPPIIYRDMKPSNVMLGPEGNIKIIDFGIAREYKEKNLTDTTVLGTRGYASPEHYGSRQTDARSDIYTLGMTLHHLLTGVNPRTPGYEYRSVRYWRPELSSGIETIIDRCTAIDPGNRYPDCGELMYDLIHIRSLTADHGKKQRKRLRIFLVTAALTAVLFTAGFSLRAQETRVSRELYDTLVSVVPSLSLEEKLKNYEEAVRLMPGETTAYFCILDAYEDEGTFDREQSDEFLSLYNKYRETFDPADVGTAELNYRIGILYFNYYTDGNDEGSFSARVQKAYPFFAANHENELLPEEFEDWDLSECYYQICSFYRSYILSPAGGEEAVRENYLELISAADGCVDSVLGRSAYDQLTLYNGIFMLIYDQREHMAAVGVDEETVLALMDRVRARAVVLTVQKEQSALLQSEILDHYTEYREAVRRAYANAKGETYG